MAAPIALAVSVNAPADRITDALSASEGLASFWATDSDAEPRTGSIARFGFGGPELQMRIDQLDPGRGSRGPASTTSRCLLATGREPP